MRTLHYGPYEIRIENDSEVQVVLDRIQEAANSGVAQWIEIRTEGDPHRLLVQPGVPAFIRGASTAGRAVRKVQGLA